MAFEEKRAWIMLVVSVCVYAVYVVLVLGRAGEVPLAEVPYVSTLLWSIGVACAVTIVLGIALGIVSPEGAGKRDQRDREIDRFGGHVGQSFLVVGGLAALALALVEADHFWIANAVYLGFFLSAVLGSIARIFAYRRGFQPW